MAQQCTVKKIPYILESVELLRRNEVFCGDMLSPGGCVSSVIYIYCANSIIEQQQ